MVDRARTVLACFSLHRGENVGILTTFFLFKDFTLNIPKVKLGDNVPCGKTESSVTRWVVADGPRLIRVPLWGPGW